MDNRGKNNSQQIIDLFSIFNLVQQGITYETAQKLNELIVHDVTSNLKRKIDKKDLTGIKNIKNKYGNFKECGLQENENDNRRCDFNKDKIHTKYLIFKQELYEKMNKIIQKYDSLYSDFKNKEVVDFDLLFEFSRIHKKMCVAENFNYKEEKLMERFDKIYYKYFSAGVYQLMYELQKCKEISLYIYGYYETNKIIKDLRKKIITNELMKMNENGDNGKMDKIINYIFKMSKYFLVCYYHTLNMDYYHITFIETCYITLRLFEYIFNEFISSCFLNKFMEIFVESNYNEFVKLEEDPKLDSQITNLNNYQELLDYYSNDLF